MPVPCSGLRIWEDNIGVKVRATKPEIKTATATAIPNSLNSLPTLPERNASGTNTATRAIVVEITANPISLLPSIAACHRLFPISIWRYIFSRTTIASSTTSPIAKTKPSKVRILIVNPAK